MADGKVLEFSGVTKVFGDVSAVSDLTARVEPGVVTAVLGPNGAGKTTSLRILLGEIRPSSGTATIGGSTYSGLSKPARTVGAVLETPVFRPRRTATRQLTSVAKANGISATRVREVLDLVGLTDVADMRIGSYSLGMRQRLSIAQALLGDPGVLVFDEPVNGMDPEGIRWMRLLMRRLADEGRTVLMSSHLLSEVQQIADRIMIISNGRLVFSGDLEDLAEVDPIVIVDSPDRDALTRVLREKGYEFEVLRSGVNVRDARAEALGVIAAEAGIVLSVLHQRGASLEDVFLDLVNGRSTRQTAALPQDGAAGDAGADEAGADAADEAGADDAAADSSGGAADAGAAAAGVAVGGATAAIASDAGGDRAEADETAADEASADESANAADDGEAGDDEADTDAEALDEAPATGEADDAANADADETDGAEAERDQDADADEAAHAAADGVEPDEARGDDRADADESAAAASDDEATSAEPDTDTEAGTTGFEEASARPDDLPSLDDDAEGDAPDDEADQADDEADHTDDGADQADDASLAGDDEAEAGDGEQAAASGGSDDDEAGAPTADGAGESAGPDEQGEAESRAPGLPGSAALAGLLGGDEDATRAIPTFPILDAPEREGAPGEDASAATHEADSPWSAGPSFVQRFGTAAETPDDAESRLDPEDLRDPEFVALGATEPISKEEIAELAEQDAQTASTAEEGAPSEEARSEPETTTQEMSFDEFTAAFGDEDDR